MRRLVALAIMLALASCAGYGAAEREARMAAYVGMSEADLLHEKGPPTRTITTDGHRFLAYDVRQVEYVPASPMASAGMFPAARGFGYFYPPRVITWACETTFEIRDGRVAGVSQRGNYC